MESREGHAHGRSCQPTLCARSRSPVRAVGVCHAARRDPRLHLARRRADRALRARRAGRGAGPARRRLRAAHDAARRRRRRPAVVAGAAAVHHVPSRPRRRGGRRPARRRRGRAARGARRRARGRRGQGAGRRARRRRGRDPDDAERRRDDARPPPRPRRRPGHAARAPADRAQRPGAERLAARGRPRGVGGQRARARDRGPAHARARRRCPCSPPARRRACWPTRTTATRSRSARCWRATSSTPPATACTTCSPRPWRASPACGTARRTRRCCPTRPSPCAGARPRRWPRSTPRPAWRWRRWPGGWPTTPAPSSCATSGSPRRRSRRASREVVKRGKDLEGTPPAPERARGQSALRGGLLMLELLTDLMNDADGRCAYAEARHVDARSEAIAVLNGRVDAIDSSELGGHRRARAGRRRLGLRRHARRHARRRAGGAGARARRRRGAAGDGGPGRWRRSRRPSGTGPRPTRSTRSPSPWRTSSSCSSPSRRRCAPATSAWCARPPAAARGASARPSPRPRARPARRRRWPRGAGIVAYATDGSDLQVRSYPTAHGGGLSAAAGWEHVLALDLAGHAPRVAEEAVALLSAPQCPQGTSTIVLHGEQVALQVHESIGHALELDRILLGEASYAGTSWVGARRPRLAALRLGAAARHRRRDPARRPGLVRLGRRGRGRRARRPRRGRRAARRAVQPRERRRRRPGRLRRLRARRRLRAPADRAHDQRLARAGDGAHARRPRRRHRRGPVPGDQPLVVDRRPPPAVPVRHRAVPRDPRRRARAPVPQRLLRRRHAALLGQRSTRSAGPTSGGCGG